RPRRSRNLYHAALLEAREDLPVHRCLDLGVALGSVSGLNGRGVIGSMRPVAVGVVTAAHLATQSPGGDHPRLDRVRLPARLVETLLPERLRDLEVDVHSDQVHELERAHPEAAPYSRDAVDLVVGRDAVA